ACDKRRVRRRQPESPAFESRRAQVDSEGVSPLMYVYLLRSVTNSKKTYVGSSLDPKNRLTQHNAGDSPRLCSLGSGRGARSLPVGRSLAPRERERSLGIRLAVEPASGRAASRCARGAD